MIICNDKMNVLKCLKDMFYYNSVIYGWHYDAVCSS